MPPLPNVPNVIRVDLTGEIGTDLRTHNRWYMSFSEAASPSDMTTLAALIRTQWLEQMSPILSDDSQISEFKVTDLTSDTGAVGIDPVVTAGSSGGPSVSAATCIVINFTIARRYRGGKPKIFIAGGPALQLADANAWSSDFVDTVDTDWGNFIAGIIAGAPAGFGALAHCNVSYYLGFTSVENPVTHRWRNVPTLRGEPEVNAVIAHAADAPLGSQRRRTRA